MGGIIIYLLSRAVIIICLVVGITLVVDKNSRRNGFIFLGLSAFIALSLLIKNNPLNNGMTAFPDRHISDEELHDKFLKHVKMNVCGAWKVASTEHHDSTYIALYSGVRPDGFMHYYQFDGDHLIEGKWFVEHSFVHVNYSNVRTDEHQITFFLNSSDSATLYINKVGKMIMQVGDELRMVRIKTNSELINELNRIRNKKMNI